MQFLPGQNYATKVSTCPFVALGKTITLSQEQILDSSDPYILPFLMSNLVPEGTLRLRASEDVGSIPPLQTDCDVSPGPGATALWASLSPSV